MRELIGLIPLIPLLSSAVLMLFAGYLSRFAIGLLGVGSVGIAAILTAKMGIDFLGNPEAFKVT
ncbi:MAG: hypothetical protein MUQ57_01080, partial [Porticoccus sp.]|nr:hypothetical protein [Porticoccus sp.]